MAEFNKGYYRRQGRIQGAAEERERIIKLLNAEYPCRLKGTHHQVGLCSCLIIALIKGETE